MISINSGLKNKKISLITALISSIWERCTISGSFDTRAYRLGTAPTEDPTREFYFFCPPHPLTGLRHINNNNNNNNNNNVDAGDHNNKVI